MRARATAKSSSAASRVTSPSPNTSRLSHATSCAVTLRPRIIALMIVRLLSIATHIRLTLLDADLPALRPALSDELEPALQNFPTGESGRSGSRSVQAQLRSSKAAWFREDERGAQRSATLRRLPRR